LIVGSFDRGSRIVAHRAADVTEKVVAREVDALAEETLDTL